MSDLSAIITPEIFFDLLRDRGGYYECPKDKNGKRIGPLVGYTGRYKDRNGEELQYVGDEYFNMRKIEENSELLNYFAEMLEIKFAGRFPYHLSLSHGSPSSIDVVCGVPEGGKALSLAFADIQREYGVKSRYVCPEKIVTAAATRHTRKRYEFAFKKGEIRRGDRVVIIDDVLNNFSTADALVELINGYGGKVITIAALLNRSPKTRDLYESGSQLDDPKIPVVSLAEKVADQYRQDDSYVADDIKNPNIGVVWKPKDNWDFLIRQMKQVNT